MGFLQPLALLALPLALIPLWLAWRGRRTGEPTRFSSLYLVERARRARARAPTRSRWITALRCAIVALLVLAAARPVGPGRGDAALHHPARAVLAVDVSASTGRRLAGATVWEAIRAAADTVLAAASGEDEIALAAVADGLAGWWEGPAPELRRRLALLAPTARASDWPATLTALADRLEDGTEAYLLTDGARGPAPPSPPAEASPGRGSPAGIPGHRVVRTWPATGPANRTLTEVSWTGPGWVTLAARARGEDAPPAAEAGRRVGARLVETGTIPLDGSPGARTWAVSDTATFGLAGPDPLPIDDVRHVARGGPAGGYRVARWVPGDEPPEPGTLFWEAALAAHPRAPGIDRVTELTALLDRPPDLALLPLREFRSDQGAILTDLAAAGSRLLFAPACADPACVPSAGWMPSTGPAAPDLRWRLLPDDRATTLSARPAVSGSPPERAPGTPALSGALLARAPVRGALVPTGGPAAEWRWDLASGDAAFWARDRVGIWLVPLGPPVTRLGTTPLLPLVAEAVLASWDPRWSAAGARVRVGEAIPLPAGGAVVSGPLGDARGEPRRWVVAADAAPPRPERPGLYRVEPLGVEVGVRSRADAAKFVSVDLDPAEGDLRPIEPEVWRTAWGAEPVAPERWADSVFPRRRGRDLWPMLVALAVVGLVAEALARREA